MYLAMLGSEEDRERFTLLYEAHEKRLYAVALKVMRDPTRAEDAALTWTSFNPEVATVDENGVVTAHKPGYAYIKVSTDINTSVTAYCVVEVLPGQGYTVTLDANGGMVKPDSVSVQYGIAVGQLPVPVREGYTFDGWYDENGAQYTEDTIYAIAGDATLTARWTANIYEITLDANGGVTDVALVQVTFGQAVGALPTPTREGYVFLGWFDEVGSRYDASTVYSTADGVTLTARWGQEDSTFTITLNANGGKVEPSALAVVYGQAVGTLPVPTREGYTFGGWYDKDGNRYDASSVYSVKGDTTLTARWIENSVQTGDGFPIFLLSGAMMAAAAGAVMLVLPAYFHHYEKFKRIIIFGEFMAVGAVIMCMLFIVVDLGQPQRALNVLLHPTPNSVMFWDMTVLFGYLLLNIIIGWVTLEAARNDVKPPKWIKVLIYISIIWAFSIHTVTGFLYAGIPGRHYWLTAIMAARFLASAFCSGPAILLLLLMAVRRVTGFEPGREAMKTLSTIITYAMCVNVFFYLLEIFTAFYSGIPGHQHSILYLFTGHDGHMAWINSWMWTAVVFAVLSLLMLIPPALRYNDKILPWALILLVIASWIDKSLGLLIGGFVPNMFETVTEYTPTIPEILVALGVYGLGGIIISVLWKIAMDVKKENGTFALKDN